MKKQQSAATAYGLVAASRVARLTLTHATQIHNSGRELKKPLLQGQLRLGRWRITLDDPFALGALARCMLVQRIQLFSNSGDLLTRDIRRIDDEAPTAPELNSHHLNFLHFVKAGFVLQPLTLHVVPGAKRRI